MSKLTPPQPAEKPLKITVHGDTRVDEFAWLREAESPEVKRYIDAENAYAEKMLAPTKKLQKQLYAEIKKRMKETDMSVPVKEGEYLYYTKTKKGKQYAIHCRKHVKTRKEEILLDENILAKGEKFFSLGSCEVNPHANLLAYSVDTSGNEKYRLYIRDMDTGKLLPEIIESVADVEWAEDGKHLFYTVEEHPHPPRKVFLHRLGESAVKDVLVFEELDLQWYVALDKSRSKKYIFLVSGNFDASEVRYLPAANPTVSPRLFAKRAKKHKYFPEHHGEYFYIMSNERAVNYKIMRTSEAKPEKKHWKPWIAHDLRRALTGFLAHADFFVITQREKGSEEIYIHKAGEPRGRKLVLPEAEHAIQVWSELEYDSGVVRFSYQSFLEPKTVFDYDVKKKTFTIKKKQVVPGWNAKEYVSKRIWVKSGNVKVPVILFHSTKVRQNGAAPLLLEAYGAYGITSDPYFSISKLSLVKRGWIIALAHPRGGGEMGWQWHEEAKLKTKHRTYEDVIAIADHLVAKKYAAREKMALMGGSAGGMMVGAVLNMRPDLVGATIAYVPAADLLTSSFDESLGGTRLHYDETGDPRKPDMYRYLKKYSPYEGVRTAAYPTMLVRANLNDIRTPYWEAAKWVARLRKHKTDSNPLLMKTETVAGHFGRSGRYEWIKDRAFDFAFLIQSLSSNKK